MTIDRETSRQASDELVLLTGISGFVARHIAIGLLGAGYRVRGTVRSPAKGDEVRAALQGVGGDVAGLELVEADLSSDEGWDAAAAGCRFVQHTASPFPRSVPRDRQALVPIAEGGTRRVIAAAGRAGVERVVVTSSTAAVQYGHANRKDRPFDDGDFSYVGSSQITPYAISKTLAERAAWEAAGEAGIELVSINPAVVFGSLIDRHVGTSASIVAMMMRGRLPAVPDMSFGVVDVRDVAAAHVAAMRSPEAAGRRFILSAGTRSLTEIASAIGDAQPAYRSKMPRLLIPDGLVRAAALVYRPMRQIVPELGRRKSFVTAPAETILGVRFTSPEAAVAAMAESLVRLRLV